MGRGTTKKQEPRTALTARQTEILEWIQRFAREHGMPPTVREIGEAFGIRSSSVFDLLQALERKGHLRRGDRGARSLILEGQASPSSASHEVRNVPVVGRIAAGRPIEAIEGDRGTVAVNGDLLRGREVYALKVGGDSMMEAGILDGDYVIVRKQATADDGDIVVALIEGEATLKRFFREGDGVRLQPENRTMAPIHVTSGEFRIQGKVVGVQRLLDTPQSASGE